MSKAIQGVAMLGGALGLGAAAFFDPALLASPLFDKALAALVIGGISMEAGALAGALTSNRGTNITTRQAAAFRQIIYGEQRVGGVTIYQSTTGSHHDQYNYVIVLAGHTIHSIVNLYLDGRQVFFTNGVGTTTRNGVTFGGSASNSTHTGPGGQQYNFGSLVYCEACYGDQTNQPNTTAGGGFNTGLQANDSTWAPTSDGIPYVGGCAYIYLKVEYDAAMFASAPEIRVTLRGKDNIYDPRTGTRAYSTNAALIVADVIEDTQFGLGDVGSVNTAQLIAAANICDEQVEVKGLDGATESRYACHWHYDTATAPGDALQQLLPSMGGRLSRIGGEWYIWPAAWQGPSFAFDADSLADGFQWKPYRSYRDLVNRVTGTYIAPNYPYNVEGNFYDSNGFYEGSIQNNFNFAFQPTNYPQFACDVLHGYPSDQYLAADGGNPLPMELALSCVLSISQAQRLAKIALLRNRQQGIGTLTMFLEAYQMQPVDVFLMTMPQLGWTNKVLEVNSVKFSVTPGANKAPVLTVLVGVNETASSVYEWDPDANELTIYDVPASPVQQPYIPAAPENLVVTSSAATAIVGLDGIVRPRARLTWDQPLDGFAQQIHIQHQAVGDSTWADDGFVGIASTSAYVDDVIAGSAYNFRICSVRANGATSAWVEVDNVTAGLVLSNVGQDGLSPGSLIGIAFSDGSGGIECDPFNTTYGSTPVTITPTPTPDILTGLNQSQLYYVYYVDAAFAGGAVMPIATQDVADFQGILGYFLIGSCVVPYAASGGGTGSRYRPSNYSDSGTRTVQSPEAAYDGDTTSVATVSASGPHGGSETAGNFTVYGFDSVVTTSAGSLKIVLSSLAYTGLGALTVKVNIAGTVTSPTFSAGAQTISVVIPTGTSLDAVSVQFLSSAPVPSGSGSSTCSVQIADVYILTS